MKRAITIALAAAALCVVMAAVLGRNELIERWYVYQISRDESRFDELLREGGELQRRALKGYLRTAEGQRFLQRRCQTFLERVSDIYRSSWYSNYPSHMEKWMAGTWQGSFVVLADQHFLYVKNPGSRDRIIRGSADLDELSAFLDVADESLGRKFDVPDSPGLTVEIVTSREAARRGHVRSPVVSIVPAGWVDTREREYQALLSGAAQTKRRAQVQSGGKGTYREFGDHPALFYSRE